MSSTPDAILTGLPRSGTNLACTLLNRVEGTVALSEPMDVGRLGRAGSAALAVDMVEDFAAQQRRSLTARGVAISKHFEGRIQDNFFDAERAADGLRRTRAQVGEVRFDRPLGAGFRLVIKHPAAFAALLPELATRMDSYALVRNPLAVLASWGSNRISVREGRAPAAEAILPALARRLDAVPDRIDRQLQLLDWFFETFQTVLPASRVIRYEAVIESGGAALAVIAPAASTLAEPLQARNANPLYQWEQQQALVERLLASNGSYWQLYSRSEVEALYAAARSNPGPETD